MFTFILGVSIGCVLSCIVITIAYCRLNNIPISIARIQSDIMTQYKLSKYLNTKQTAFRLTKDDLKDAFPANKFENSHFIHYLPGTHPSPEYQLYDETNYSAKITTIENEKKTDYKQLTRQEMIHLARQNMSAFPILCGKPDANCKIIDNIYLNKDIRFAVLAYNGSNINTGIICHMHGGGHISGDHRYGFAMLSLLSKLTGCIAISIDYKLCPEYTITDSMNDILTVYRWLNDYDSVRTAKKMNITDNVPDYLLNANAKNINKRIIFSGDSAGGNVCLLCLQAISNDNNMELPLCGWPISPMTNLGEQFDSAKRNEMRDNMITSHHMKHYFNIIAVRNVDLITDKNISDKDDNYSDPNDGKYSSVNGLWNWKGICPLYFTVGATEILLDDALIAAERAYKCGVDVTVEIEPYLCHVYPIFVNLFPEAKYAVARAANFIVKMLRK